ncbi:DUF6731 family protein [Agathobaculum hominis]
MPTIKDIKFQYAILLQENEQGQEVIFDFEAWLNRMKRVHYPDRIKRVHTNLIRLDKVEEENEQDHLIGIRFFRLRDNNIPYKVPNQGEAQDINIADDEYIGEGLHIVYDTVTHYFMIQINRNSIGLNSIAGYITQTLYDGENPVFFRAFHKDLHTMNFQERRYKNITVGFANADGLPQPAFRSMGGICDALQKSEAHDAVMKVGVGRKKNKFLNTVWALAVVQEIVDNINWFTTAKITYCTGHSNQTQKLNLLDLLEVSILRISMEARRTIDFNDMIGRMKQEYLIKREALDRMRNRQ